MALSIPNRFAATEYTSAAKMNANFDAIATEVNSAEDDITTNTAAIAALTTTVAKHGSYAFTAQSAAATTITAGAATTIALATEVLDADSAFASNVFTPGASGVGTFLFTATVYINAIADTGVANLLLYKNTTPYTLGKLKYQDSGTYDTGSISGSIILTAGATDTFEIKVSGTNVAGNFTVDNATFSGVRLLPS